METAPLTLAHAHARNASSETQRSNIIAAREEHELAAGEFANAAKGVADLEVSRLHKDTLREAVRTDQGSGQAQRILKLLEEEHHKLAQIIKAQSQRATAPSNTADEGTSPQRPSSPPTSAKPAAPPPTSPSNTALSPPAKTSAQNKAQRVSSSSIASNLATARGIPSPHRRRADPASPTLSAQQAGGKLLPREESRLSPESHLRSTATRRRTSGTENLRSKAEKAEASQGNALPSTKETPSAIVKNEEPFQKFFSTFESLFSRLSAPLAYAGLPLNVEEPVPEEPSPAAQKTREKTSARITGEQDLGHLFSKAALRALKDDHGPNAPFGGGESFYVVPTTGGTVSYAGIVSRPEQEARDRHNLADVAEESGEDGSGSFDQFVDASEVPAPPSPRSIRSRQPTLKRANSSSLSNSATARITPRAGAGAGAGKKTMEELQLENTALRQLLDTQSRRLQMWEASAQSQSLALAQSFRAMQPALAAETASPPSLAQGGAKPTDVASDPSRTARTSDTGRSPNGAEPPAVVAAAAALAAEERTRRLEEQVRAAQREMEACAAENAKFARENEKLRTVIGRYREKWEQLKAGARMRRETNATTATAGSPTVGEDDVEKGIESNGGLDDK